MSLHNLKGCFTRAVTALIKLSALRGILQPQQQEERRETRSITRRVR